jgi:peptidyl-prolyl cis-trans isomerase C
MSERSDTTDRDATIDGGSAWARLALSLADRDDPGDGGGGAAREHDAPVPAASADADPGAWGLIGSALRPAATEPEVEVEVEVEVDQAETSAWGRVAGALGADQPTNRPAADPPTSPVSGKPAGAKSRALSTGRRRVAAAAVVVVVVAAALVVGLVILPGGGLPAGTAFRVQGQDTSVGQLDAQVTVLNALYGVTVPSPSAPGYSVFEKTEAKALAVSELIDRLAAARGLTVPAKTARTALDNYVNQNYGGNQTTFATALGNAGLNQDELLTELTHQALVQKLFAAVVGKAPTVSAAQVDAYFQAHTAALATQETRAISSIVVATQAQAQALVADLKAGQSFATLASQQSLDSSTKANGGALGTLRRNQLDAAFGQAAFAATVNSPFGPVQDNGHWYVGLVTKTTPGAAATDDTRTRAAIRTYLQDQAQLARWDSYLSREIRAAHITYAPAYQPSNPFQPPQTPLPTLTGASIASASSSTSTAGGAATGGASGAASSTAP